MEIIGKKDKNGHLRIEYKGLIVNKSDLRAMVRQGINTVKFFDKTYGKLIVRNAEVYVEKSFKNIPLTKKEKIDGFAFVPFRYCERDIKGIQMGKKGVFVAERKDKNRPLKTTGKGYFRSY